MSLSERTPGYRNRSHVPPRSARPSRITNDRSGHSRLRWQAAPMPDNPAPTITTSKCSGKILAVEDLADARVVEDRAQSFGDDAGDREHLDLRDLLLRRERQRVGEHDASDRRVLEAVDGRARGHAVGRPRPHPGGAPPGQ